MKLFRDFLIIVAVCLGLVAMQTVHVLAADEQAGSSKAATDSSAKSKKPKDKYKYPKIIGQFPSELQKVMVKGNYLILWMNRGLIGSMSVDGGEVKILVSTGDSIKGIAIDDEYIYFTNRSSIAINKIPLAGGEPSVFRDLASVEVRNKTLGALAVDDEHVYAIMGMNVIQLPKEGGNIVSLIDNTPFVESPLWVDENNIYWSPVRLVQMREKDRDIADIYNLGNPYSCTSMAGNSKAFYYAGITNVNSNNSLVEVILENKDISAIPIPDFGQYAGAEVFNNGLSCDEEQVYVSAKSGVWYMKTGADKLKLVEDTKGLRCQGMAVDDKYIYFSIRSNLYKMTKPKYE